MRDERYSGETVESETAKADPKLALGPGFIQVPIIIFASNAERLTPARPRRHVDGNVWCYVWGLRLATMR